MLFEYLAKGLVLGILVYLGWLPTLVGSLIVYALLLLGLAAGLALAALHARRQGSSPKASGPAYALYLLLEYPTLLFECVAAGALAGSLVITAVGYWTWNDLGIALGLGIGLGIVMIGLRRIAHVLV